MTRRTNGEGGLITSRKDELIEYRKTHKEVCVNLTQAQERVKELKAQKADLESRIGWTIDHLDQPDLPFSDE